MNVFSEASVQSWLVERLASLGWSHKPGHVLDRESTDVLVESELVDALIRLNPVIAEAPERVDEVLPGLRSAILSASFDGLVPANERLVRWLRGAESFKFIGRDDHVPVRLIDFDDFLANSFWVSGPLPGSATPIEDEVTFGAPGDRSRFDVVLWVNGIPLVVGETKSPVSQRDSWLTAARDIADTYELLHPPFFAPNVLSFATEGHEFHYGAVGQPAESWLLWGATEDPYNLAGVERVQRSVDLLLTPERVLSILQSFTLFERVTGGQIIKLIPRYPQVEAVEAIHQRVLAGGRKGLVWHYQGSGKTILMAFAALALLNDDRVNAPTIVIVLDRIDLVDQIRGQFKSAGLPRLTEAETSHELRELLASNYTGIIVTTVFRFKDAGELNTRDNVIVMVDEAHRTQEGTLGDDMREALPNASFFGLTGTPIADKDRNTYKLFGDPNDPDYVLSSYSIERSIADGVSVPVHVENRLVTFHLDQAALTEAEQQLAQEEGLTEAEQEFLAKQTGRLKTLLLNPERITAVCSDILDHYVTKMQPLGLKAQVVAADRELVVAYNTELNRLITERELPFETQIVMTAGNKSDPVEWRKYDLDRAQEEHIKERFKNPEDNLTFLVVTAKLLTGFDAPILGVQYLDRPLTRHTLFQAITRTNRRYYNPITDVNKTYGLIVDYIGLGNEIGKALKAADPDTEGRRPYEVDELAEAFTTQLDTTLEPFAGIDRSENNFETLTTALERIREPDARDQYARNYMKLTGLWEFLYPHETLTQHESDYKWLTQIYTAATPAKTSNELLWHKLGPKTLAMVHANISDVQVKTTSTEEVVVDPEAIEAIRELAEQGEFPIEPDRDLVDDPITVDEVFTLIDKRIQRRLDNTTNPAYRTIAEQIETLRTQTINRAQDSIEFLKKALELARRIIEADKLEAQGKTEEAETILDPNIGALTQIVEQYAPTNTPIIVSDLVRDIDKIVKTVAGFTGWANSSKADRDVRQALRKTLQDYALPATGDLFNAAYDYIKENY